MDGRTNVMIVGAQKAATTTLFDFLTGPGGVTGATPKEPHFFSTVDAWPDRLDRYHRIYGGKDGPIRCEASTSYTFFPHRRLEIWNDIRDYNPNMRIIYIVRRPADRILSHFRHAVRRGYWKGGIRDFVVKYPLALAISRYHTQIAPFVETFGRANVLLLEFDDVVAMTRETRDAISRFIGLEPHRLDTAPPVHSNVGNTVRHHRLTGLAGPGGALDRLTGRRRAAAAAEAELPGDLHRAIDRALELEIRALERLMQRDLGAWRRG